MKGIFVILDGAADEPCQALGQKTPLEAAKTPNLDELAKKSKIDYCYTVKEGVAPESSSAVVSLLGHDPNLSPRGPLEASGTGLKLTRGDLALRANFATVDDLKDGQVLDSRAGRTLTTREAEILAKEINQKVKLPFKFEFFPTAGHRGVLVFRGGFSDNVSDVHPFYNNGFAKNNNSKISLSRALDDEDDSRLAADLINNFLRQSHEILDKHPLNVRRAQKGLFSANFLLVRGAGNEPAKFKKLKGRWMALGYMPLEIGIANASKMDIYKMSYPAMRGIDAYGNLYDGLNKAIKRSIKMLVRNRKKYDYFYIHLKETDIPGHDNKPLDKVKMIEMIDKKLFSFLKRFVEKNDAKLVVTSDHTTSCRQKAHTADPVPVLYYNPSDIKNYEQRFTEEQAMKGKKIVGRKLLEKTLFVK